MIIPARKRRNLRGEFYRLYKEEAQSYSPQKVQIPSGSTIFARMNVRRAIKEAARRKMQVIILYWRISEPKRSVEYYKVSPISFRYKKLSVGVRKILYAWDMELLPHQMQRKMKNPQQFHTKAGRLRKTRGTLKNFVLRNILNCYVTDEAYPVWARKKRIEIV